MKQFFQIFFLILFTQFSFGQAPIVIINEVSTGPNGSSQAEYVELLVVGDCSTSSTIDLRGWYLDDNNGAFYSNQVSQNGRTTGCNRFRNTIEWSAIPVGAILLIYNDASADLSFVDDPTDSNNDSIYIIPISSSLMEVSGKPGYDSDYPTNPADFTQGGSWGSVGTGITLNDKFDVSQIRSPASISGTAKADFALSWGTRNQTGKEDAWLGANLDNNLFVGNLTDSLINGSIPTGTWARNNIQTPGAANNAINLAWITNMRKIPRPNTLLSVTVDKSAVCSGESAVLTVVNAESNKSYTVFDFTTNAIAPEVLTGNPSIGTGGNLNFTLSNLTTTKTYKVQVEDIPTGCIDFLVDTEPVTVNTGPSITLKPIDTLCLGEFINLNNNITIGTQFGYTYNWSPAVSLLTLSDSTQASPSVSPKAATTYTLEFQSPANTCTGTATTELRVFSKPSLQFTTTNMCTPANLNAIVSDLNNTSSVDTFYTDNTYSVQITDPSNVTVSQQYFVRTTNPQGCFSDSSFTINQAPNLKVSRQSGRLCKPLTVSLDTVVSDLNGGVFSLIEMHQDPERTISQGITPISVSDTIWFRKTNQGCIDTDSVILTFTELDDANFTIDTFCKGSTPPVPVKSTPFTFGTYSVSGGLTINAGSGQVDPGSASGTYIMSFTTSGNCPNTKTDTLVINPLPSADFSINCNNGSYQGYKAAISNSTFKYEWFVEGLTFPLQTGGTVFSKNNIGTILPPGVIDPVYYLKVTNNVTGCIDSVKKPYSALPYPDISVSDTSICRGQAFNLDSLITQDNSPNQGSSSSAISYHYAYTTDPLKKPYGQGYLFNVNKTLVVYALKTIGGCANVVPVRVFAKALPIPDFSYLPVQPSFPSAANVQFTDLSTTTSAWSWRITHENFGFLGSNQNPTIAFPDSGLYIVKLVATNTLTSCVDSVSKQVHVAGDLNIYIPSAFSPNFDGLNEKITPYLTTNDISDYLFEVYNSWGGLVYSSTDISDSFWDGTVGGTLSPQGTYMYNIQFVHNKNTINQKGHFLLIR